jgi:hypothetical protein
MSILGLEDLEYADAEEAGILQSEVLDKTIANIVAKIETGRILILVKRLAQGGT